MGLMTVLDRAYILVIHALGYLSIALMVLFTGWIGLEVGLRALGFGSTVGVVEFTEYAIFSMALLSAPWVLYRNAHVRVLVLIDLLSLRNRRSAMKMIDVLSAIICAILAKYAFSNFFTSLSRGEKIYGELVFPEWWLQWQAPVCFALLAIGFLKHALQSPLHDAAATIDKV